MRVLIGCETSGIARRAFADLGHDVWSCDIEQAEDGSNRHIVCDIRDGILEEGWDLLAVMHPPLPIWASLDVGPWEMDAPEETAQRQNLGRYESRI